jgi:hypothetical protein
VHGIHHDFDLAETHFGKPRQQAHGVNGLPSAWQ